MKRPKWDTELGRLLWLDGRKDGEIADECGIPISTVTSYRKRHWEKGMQMPPQNGQSEDEKTTELEDTEEVLSVPEEIKHESTRPCFQEPANVYEILEAATSNLSGIHAICTADAILCLWNWNGPEDLKRAKAAIEYLLKKHDEKM